MSAGVDFLKNTKISSNEIQGLVGVKNDEGPKAAYLHWACTAPHNNKRVYGTQRYSGVGGHLFAIAVDKAIQWGYNGVVRGFALNKELLNHYIDVLGATYLGAIILQLERKIV